MGGQAGRTADGGFTLVEVIVAMAIFVAVSSATLVLLMTAIRTAGENRDRVYAASVARAQVETLRALGSFGARAAVEAQPTLTVTTVDTRKQFTVTRNATWLAVGNTWACDTTVNPKEALLRLRVEVSGGTLAAPQRVETLVHTANLKGGIQGSITVRVKDAAGLPLAGATVAGSRTGGSFSQVTGPSGCVFMPALATGTWSITVGLAGYTPNPATATATVTGGQNTSVPSVTLTKVGP